VSTLAVIIIAMWALIVEEILAETLVILRVPLLEATLEPHKE